jgi:hypothetical protein
MAENIKYRGNVSKDSKEINKILPDFVLCLRDFSLKLVKDGKKITEKEYLEECIADNESQTEELNQPRACIRKYFQERTCFAFPVPGDGDVLANLDTIRFSDLSARFKETTKRFVSYIYRLPPKELVVSTPVKGQSKQIIKHDVFYVAHQR